MITIINAQNEKSRFRRMFQNVSNVSVVLKPEGYGRVLLKIQGDNLCFTATGVDNLSFTLKNIAVYLAFVETNDCVFDLLFDKEGFYVELYPKAYTDLKTVSVHGVEGFISEVIFKTKRKTTHFMSACNESCQMIQTLG